MHKYHFVYGVNDDEGDIDFGHEEKNGDELVSGSYFVRLPDGRKQTVDYQSKDNTGYEADIKYDERKEEYLPATAYRGRTAKIQAETQPEFGIRKKFPPTASLETTRKPWETVNIVKKTPGVDIKTKTWPSSGNKEEVKQLKRKEVADPSSSTCFVTPKPYEYGQKESPKSEKKWPSAPLLTGKAPANYEDDNSIPVYKPNNKIYRVPNKLPRIIFYPSLVEQE